MEYRRLGSTGLEGGFLTGKYERGGAPPEGSRWDAYGWADRFEARQWRVLDAVREVADDTPGHEPFNGNVARSAGQTRAGW